MFNVLNYVGGGFSPLDLEPQAYYKFNTGITYDPSTKLVSSWQDQTGNGYNATQAIAAQQPIYNEADGIIRGSQYKSLNTGYSWTDPSTLIARVSIGVANTYYMGHNVSNYKRVRSLSSNQGRTEYAGGFNNPYAQTIDYNTFLNLSIVQDSPSTANGFKVFIEGIELVNVATPATVFSGGSFLIGSVITNYIFSGGYFNSLALFNRVLDNTEREQVENYFSNESI